MIHTLALLARRPDFDRAKFRRHYEAVHAPLALPHLVGVRDYVRNHVLEAVIGPDPDFDVLTEFAYTDRSSVDKTMAMLASSEAGEQIRLDELRFMDKPRNRFFEIEPLGRGDDLAEASAAPAVKLALLLPPDRGKELSRRSLETMMTRWLTGSARWRGWRAKPGSNGTRELSGAVFIWSSPDVLADSAGRLEDPLGGTGTRLLRVEECIAVPSGEDTTS